MKIAVFTKNRSNPAYEAARLGADRAAWRFGAQTLHFVPEKGDDPVEQSQLIEEALGLPPDAFAIAPVHPSLVNAALQRINAAGIPLFAFINPVSAARCVCYVGSDDYRLGFEIAQHLYAHMKGRGRVLLVSGPLASVTSNARVRAFRDAAALHPGVTIAGACAGDYVREVARDAVLRWIASNGPFDGCAAANDVMALGVADALREAGRKATIVGVNAIPGAIEAIKNGDMLATADFDAMRMAFLATECAIRHLRGERVPANIELPVQIVEHNNLHVWDVPYTQRSIPTLAETVA